MTVVLHTPAKPFGICFRATKQCLVHKRLPRTSVHFCPEDRNHHQTPGLFPTPTDISG